ncbi:metallopeptidase [Diaporthe helianthi]|uniref:Metallopeptidase n=1 Tax=Diaporthe helianthi TaxID=158607 RepID=A0A2P5HH98_DIAHE|nr:metallopeptidase [Diaporthe helianthi]
MFTLNNIRDGEVVHQRCVLVTGRCEANGEKRNTYVCIETKDGAGRDIFPEQRWPMCQGWFKALLILTPGENLIDIISDDDLHKKSFRLQYVPLLQTPPLYLAILVAKDSPLAIDCPPRKYGSLSNSHSSLKAAISKLRTTAYMWQALTADESASNDLGRRSFRLEEEWAADTISESFTHDMTMQSTAKIHLIRTDKTVAELRNAHVAQQNPNALYTDNLHRIFTEALLAHGAPFTSEAKPVVAGLILDSHYDAESKLILAHAAQGAHCPNGLSLGIFGSHLAYSWPRFLEEIPNCLLDERAPGDRVGNGHGDRCVSMWKACAVGQGAFLREVGHAFSAPDRSAHSIMATGYSSYSKDWPKCFLARTASCAHDKTEGVEPVMADTPNECRVDLCDDDDVTRVVITCEAGIARIWLGFKLEARPSLAHPQTLVQYTRHELQSRLDLRDHLMIEVLSMNGKSKVADLSQLFASSSSFRVPGTIMRLKKRIINDGVVEEDDWRWAVMLKKRGRDGDLVPAYKIDIRVGCALDGAIVYYKDGTKVPCGPRGKDGDDPPMGGHQARKIAIPNGVDVVKVAVTKGISWGLCGLRIWLSNGRAMGFLNRGGVTKETLVLTL